MYVDASALCAVFLEEPDSKDILSRMRTAKRLVTSPTGIWEAIVSCSHRLDTDPLAVRTEVIRFLAEMAIDIVPIPPEATVLAVDAYARYGKGRHRAALNFGDCFAYACARHYAVPLLYKGDDFAATDIQPA